MIKNTLFKNNLGEKLWIFCQNFKTFFAFLNLKKHQNKLKSYFFQNLKMRKPNMKVIFMFFLYQLITGSMCFNFCSISRKYSKSSKYKFRKFWLCYVIQRLPMTQLCFGTLHLKFRQNRSILTTMQLSSRNNIICRHFIASGNLQWSKKKMYTIHLTSVSDESY